MFDLVIPCAGKGSRLGKFTQNITKNMVMVNNISLFEHQINSFASCKKKINFIYIILGYKSKKLKSFISSLNLPFKFKFYTNKDYFKSECGGSLKKILNKLKNNTIIINSDLILENKKIHHIFNNKHQNFFYARKRKDNIKKRKIGARVINKKIVKIDTLEKDSNLEVVGPFKINKKAIKKLKFIVRKISKKELAKISCFSLLGKLSSDVRFKYGLIKDKEWYEINTKKDYFNATRVSYLNAKK